MVKMEGLSRLTPRALLRELAESLPDEEVMRLVAFLVHEGWLLKLPGHEKPQEAPDSPTDSLAAPPHFDPSLSDPAHGPSETAFDLPGDEEAAASVGFPVRVYLLELRRFQRTDRFWQGRIELSGVAVNVNVDTLENVVIRLHLTDSRGRIVKSWRTLVFKRIAPRSAHQFSIVLPVGRFRINRYQLEFALADGSSLKVLGM
jgi:hypothetical protein